MTKDEALRLVDGLEALYPDARPALNFGTPYELLVAVVLSAQCTDARVNKVTEKLFAVANTPEKMLRLKRTELEKYIYSCGFYHAKALPYTARQNGMHGAFAQVRGMCDKRSMRVL